VVVTSPEAVTGASATDTDRIIARIERVPVSRFHWRVAGTLGAGTFFDAFDIVAIGVVLTAVSGTFHLNSAQAGWLVSAGFLGQGIGAVGFGLASARLGRRTVFLTALLLIGCFAAVSVVSWNGFSLGAIRLLQGLGLGAEVPVASALLAELVTGPRRGRVSVLYKLASPLGNLTGSLVAAALLAAAPPSTAWRLLFAVGAAPLLVAVVAAGTLPESPRYLVRRGRYAEAEAIVTAMEASAAGRLAPATERTAPADLGRTRFGELFSADYARRTRLAWVLWFTGYFVLLGATVWLPSQVVRIGHVSQSRASLLAGSIVVGAVVLILVVAALVERDGRRPLLIAGYTVSLLGGLLGTGFWLTGSLHGWLPLYLAGLLLLLGVSAIDPLIYAYTAELFPTRMRSWASLSASAWRAVAAVIAPIVIGQLLQAGLGIGVVFALFTVVVLIGLTAQAGWGVETKRAQLERIAR
jgi:putative MFS transporter